MDSTICPETGQLNHVGQPRQIQIVLETTAVASGPRLLLDEKLVRVSIHGKPYRKPKPGQTFESAVKWIADSDIYSPPRIVRPKKRSGTVTVRRFYTEMSEAEIKEAQAMRDSLYDAGIGYGG